MCWPITDITTIHLSPALHFFNKFSHMCHNCARLDVFQRAPFLWNCWHTLHSLSYVSLQSLTHGEFKSTFSHSELLPCHQCRFMLLTELQISITSHKKVPVIFLFSIKMTLQDQGFTETPKVRVCKLLRNLRLMTLKNFNDCHYCFIF